MRTFAVAGFLRLDGGATGNRYVWRSNADSRTLRASGAGALRLRLDGQTLNAPGGTLNQDTWHHVAVVRTAARIGLWVDGVEVADGTPGSATTIDSRPWQMVRAIGGVSVDLALDEWGIWSAALDVAELYGRREAYRAFGGYVYGLTDNTDLGPADRHVLELSCAGYGLRLDHSFVRQIYASATGMSVRAIVQDVLALAGVDDDFSSHGVELTDTVIRAVFPVQSVMSDPARTGGPPRGHRDR